MYNAIKQKSGKYIIPNVEIFIPYEDEKIDPPRVDSSELFDFVENFEKQRSETQLIFGSEKNYLPRVHVSHHDDGTENRVGVGFLDNLLVRNNILYADMIGVPEVMVEDLANGKYPYRSVEFVGKDKDKRIVSLALLESREPYHKLPIMDEVVKLQKNNSKSVRIVVDNVEALRVFQNNKERKLEDENKDGVVLEDDKTKMQDDPAPSNIEEDDESFDYAAYAEKYGCSEDEVKKMMKKYADENLSEEIKRMQSEPVDPDKPVAIPSGDMKKFQASVLVAIGSLQREIKTLKREKEIDVFGDRLRRICSEDTSVNFQAEKQILGELSAKNRETYLSRLERGVQFQSPVRNDVLGVLNPGELKKYESKIAGKLGQAYENTLRNTSGETLKMFQALYPDKKNFVEFGLEQEKKSPGYCKKNLLEGE